jgi:hypothetical protein
MAGTGATATWRALVLDLEQARFMQPVEVEPCDVPRYPERFCGLLTPDRVVLSHDVPVQSAAGRVPERRDCGDRSGYLFVARTFVVSWCAHADLPISTGLASI